MRSIRTLILPALAVAAIGTATPVLAADYIVGQPSRSQAYVERGPMVRGPMDGQAYMGPVTLQQALVVASQIGVVTVSETNFDDNQWKIEGRDLRGKYIEVDVDATTGEVRDVDRGII